MNSNEPHHFGEVAVTRETDSAILVETEDGETHWIPKSQIHDDSEVWKADQHGDLVVKQWFAEQRGWI